MIDAEIDRRELLPELFPRPGDYLMVSGLAGASRDAAALTGDGDNLFTLAGVPLGLGMALAAPAPQVAVITGDGELLMDLGALATVASQAPDNLSIVCIDNGGHGETGGQLGHTSRAVQRSLLRVIAEQPVESADGISISRVGHVGDVVGAHDVGGETADASENAGVFADATGVLAHGDITRIVVPVFNPPVCPDGAAGGVGGEHGVRHVVGGFAGQVPEAGRGVAFEAAAVDPNDGGDKGCPFGVAEMGARIEDLDVARLVSRPRGVDGLMAVERLALVA